MSPLRRTRTTAVALAGVLALVGVACEDDGTGIDDDVEQEVGEDLEDAGESVEEGASEVGEELDGQSDDG